MGKLNLYYGVKVLEGDKHFIFISKNKTNFNPNLKYEIDFIIKELIEEFGVKIISKGIYLIEGIDISYDDICKILIFKGFIHAKSLDKTNYLSF